MLYLISIGLSDERDMSLKALETAKACGKLYAEFYTTGMDTTAEKLSELIGKPVKELDRSGMEEGSGAILEEAKSQDVGVLVGGDALSATTHISLLMDARKAGIEARVVHGSSILTAVAETGLQLYKFGRAVTLARQKSASCYRGIEHNLRVGLHTLLLLDIGMTVGEGLRMLLAMERDGKKGLVSEETMVVAASRLGGRRFMRYGTVKDLLLDERFSTPAVIIMPGTLHFMEKECLEILK
jgi:diphthine synthase